MGSIVKDCFGLNGSPRNDTNVVSSRALFLSSRVLFPLSSRALFPLSLRGAKRRSNLKTWRAAILVLWTVGALALPAYAQDADNDEDVAVIETEIRLDQIVVARPQERTAEPQSARSEPVVSVVFGSADGEGSGSADAGVTSAPAVINYEYGTVPGRDIDVQKIIQLNRVLKKAIEDNQKLESARSEMDSQLRNIRGQRVIETNRMKNMDQTVADYKAKLDQSQKQIAGLREEIAGLEQGMKQKEGALLAKEQELKAVAAAGGASGDIYSGGQAKVEVPAQELMDLRQTVLSLRGQIGQREKDIEAMTARQSQQAESGAADLKDRLRVKEEILAQKEEALSVIAREKAAAEQKAAGLAEELLAMEVRLAAAGSGTPGDSAGGDEAGQLRQRLASREEELLALNQERERAGESSEESRLAAERMIALSSEVAGIRQQLAALQSPVGGDSPAGDVLSRDPAAVLVSRPEVLEQPPGERAVKDRIAVKAVGAVPVDLAGMPPAGQTSAPVAWAGARSADDEAAFQDRVKGQKVLAMLDALADEKDRLAADEAKVHYNMGNIFFRQGKYFRARDEYIKAVEMMPSDPNAHFNLAFVAGEILEDYPTALKHYQQYLWLNPGAADVNLVKEKIIAAQMEIMGAIGSPLENDIRAERTRVLSERGGK